MEIIICTEKGFLEDQARLLVRTFRKFGGTLKDTKIYSYQPRKNRKISRSTREFFEKYNVENIDIELNKEFRHYPLANKIFAAAHREENTTSDILVFIDSDMFFVNEPTEFIDFDADVVLRPVDITNVGYTNKDDKNFSYWDKLYKLFDVKQPKRVTTTVTKESIGAYYNTGHIVSLTKNKLFSSWKNNFLKIIELNIRPEYPFFIEQTSFAVTVEQMNLKVQLFSKGYNYPLHLHDCIDKATKCEDLNQLVSVHYHSSNLYSIEKVLNGEKSRMVMQFIRESQSLLRSRIVIFGKIIIRLVKTMRKVARKR